jgi:hypothetical protein
MDEEDVTLQGVKVVRETDGSLLCVIEGTMRFIPSGHIRSRTMEKPGDVGSIVVPGWLAATLGLA